MCGYLYRLWMPTSAESRPSHTHNPSETFLDCLWLALSLLEIGIQEHCPHNQQEDANDDSLKMGNWIFMSTPSTATTLAAGHAESFPRERNAQGTWMSWQWMNVQENIGYDASQHLPLASHARIGDVAGVA